MMSGPSTTNRNIFIYLLQIDQTEYTQIFRFLLDGSIFAITIAKQDSVSLQLQLHYNYNSVRLLVQQRRPFMLLCSETCLTDEINDFEIELEDYNIIWCDSHSRFTGGVVVFFKIDISYKILLNKCYQNNLVHYC